MTETSPPPSSSALRKRRWRERQSRGVWVCGVELDNARIERLIRAGYLAEHDALDRQKVAEAIVWLVDMQRGENESADGADPGRSCTKHRNS